MRVPLWEVSKEPGGGASDGCGTADLVRHAVAQFNRGEYFEQHESFERLWRADTSPTRDLYKGLLQTGVALHHLKHGNYHGAVTLLSRAAGYLARYPPQCEGFEVAALLDAIGRARHEVERLGPAGLSHFDWRLAPRLSFHGSGS